MYLPLPVPRCLTDALAVLAEPGRYADRPSLVHLARQIAYSAQGNPLPQAGPPLRLIEGGRP